MIYIVMQGTPSSYSYDGLVWDLDRVFSSEASAKAYITEQSKIHSRDGVEYEIQTEEVYA